MLASLHEWAAEIPYGCYVAIADLNGDGYGDVIFGSGSGTPRIRIANGYVMARRPGRIPFVKTLKEWNALSRERRP